MENFFAINDTSEIPWSTLWEAHKAFIRGLLIGVGVGKKRGRGEKLSTLYREIYDLEQMTRPQGIPERQELISKREELVQLLEQDKKLVFHIVDKERYQ